MPQLGSRGDNPANDIRQTLPPHIQQVAMVLQGGGALGAFQAGVYEGMAEAGYEADWFVGVSIGAIHAAILAGNPPGRRLERLHAFWDRISRPEWTVAPPWDSPWRPAFNRAHAAYAMTCGQPGFFTPRPPGSSALAPPHSEAARSIYTPLPLRATLERLVDFERINRGESRLSLGTVNVRTGKTVYFDSSRQTIGPEHVLASTALPPAFPPVEIEGELFWDGGVVSNTPLEVVMDDNPRRSTLCLMVDLFDARGDAPADLEAVAERHKDITYASRSDRHIDHYRNLHHLRRIISELHQRLPPAAQADSHVREMASWGCTTTMSIVHMIYHSVASETHSKDYEFSRASVRDHWAAGLRDARRAFSEQRWLVRAPHDLGVEVEEIVSTPGPHVSPMHMMISQGPGETST